MSMFENFPYTNLHNLNLDWIIKVLTELKSQQVLSVNGQTGNVILYQENSVTLPEVPQQDWYIVRMADGTRRGILFGENDEAYIIHGSLMSKIYAANNPPPYPVTSVNGQTGAITLYTEQNIQLPGLTDEQLHDWNVFRNLNGVSRGIKFDDDGSAYIISGIQRYKLYSTHDVPPYPVSSVNGETGAIVLFTDAEGEVEYPAITDQSIDTFILERVINGTNVGISIHDNGGIELLIGNQAYTIYTENDPQPDWVDDPTEDIIQVSDDAAGTTWGMIRDTANGSIGILFNNNSNLTQPEAELRYVDAGQVVHTVKLLTPADIPSSSGVVSVNGLSGVVVITGNDLAVSTTDNRTIPASLEDLEEVSAYVETGNSASRNIASGSYVIWNHALHIATQAISFGDTLSSSNLQAVPDGGFNALNSKFFTQTTGSINLNSLTWSGSGPYYATAVPAADIDGVIVSAILTSYSNLNASYNIQPRVISGGFGLLSNVNSFGSSSSVTYRMLIMKS